MMHIGLEMTIGFLIEQNPFPCLSDGQAPRAYAYILAAMSGVVTLGQARGILVVHKHNTLTC